MQLLGNGVRCSICRIARLMCLGLLLQDNISTYVVVCYSCFLAFSFTGTGTYYIHNGGTIPREKNGLWLFSWCVCVCVCVVGPACLAREGEP